MNKHLCYLLPLLLLCATGAAQADQALATAGRSIIKKAHCVACHAVDQKRVGPSYQEVAAKYKDQPGEEAVLFKKVREGGNGVWGEISMTPNGEDKISDEDLHTVLKWILSGAE